MSTELQWPDWQKVAWAAWLKGSKTRECAEAAGRPLDETARFLGEKTYEMTLRTFHDRQRAGGYM